MKFGKDNNRKRHANERMRTSFANSGRIAGTGILYDDYSETSYPSGMMRTDYFPEKKVGIPLTEEEKNQMVLEEVEEENKVYGEIKFIFGNELSISISDDFVISDDVLNKLKNNFKKLHYLYLQIYFRTAKARK